MKKIIFSTLFVIFGIILFASFDSGLGKKDGAEPGYTGSPGDTLKNCTACHGGTAYNEIGWIKSTIPTTGYVPGATYTIEAIGYGIGHNRFGFLISPQAINGNLLGSLVRTDTVRTKFVGNNKYITYTENGVDGIDSAIWYFDWVAPAKGTGDVIFYGGFNSNQDGHKGGDVTHLSTLRVKENGTASINGAINELNSVSVYPNPMVDVMNLSFELKNNAPTKIDMMDLSGKIVTTIANENMNGLVVKQFNISGLENGIYFVRIQTDNKLVTKKITIIH